MGRLRIELDNVVPARVRARLPLRPLVAAVAGLFVLAACSGGVDEPPAAAAGSPATNGASGAAVGDAGPAAGVVAGVVSRAPDASPDFELALFSNDNHEAGEQLKLSDLAGRPVLVNFWFPSCPPCRLEMPDFEKAFQTHKGNGVEFIGVQILGFDSIEDGQEFVNEFGINYAIGPDADGSILKDYSVSNFPTTFFLDAQHKEVRKWAGPLNEAKLEELIQELLQ